jgi:site-specific DNA-cytosine methylase
MRFGSVFSGIGGIDLGLERAGMRCSWQVENDRFCQKVLKKHWPSIPLFSDIRECGAHNLPPVDLIAGGFPCQPHSLAGDRKGSGDERDLWPEFHRIICELKPAWVLGENVPGLLSSEEGSFFGQILRDLAQSGYDVEWRCLRASDFGAPHKRERTFFVAHSDRLRESRQECTFTSEQRSTALTASLRQWQDRAAVPYSGSERCQERDTATGSASAGLIAGGNAACRTEGILESFVGRIFDGFPPKLDGYQWPAPPGEAQKEWEPPRVTPEKENNASSRLKALGNAVVPQVAEYIGRQLLRGSGHDKITG